MWLKIAFMPTFLYTKGVKENGMGNFIYYITDFVEATKLVFIKVKSSMKIKWLNT